MKTATKWFIDNPVAANLLMMFILVAGFLTMGRLRVESFPQIPPTRLTISVEYPGGTARQVDEGITQRIENAVRGIAGIKSVVSESRPESAMIHIRKATGVNLDRLIDDVRNQIDSIKGFPSLAERPVIQRDEFTNLAAFILIYGGHDQNLLQKVAVKVKNKLQSNANISQITNLGKRKQELRIEPDLEKLKQYGLDPTTLSERISQFSMEFRSGKLKSSSGVIVLKGDRYADNLLKLKNLPVITTPDAMVRLSDVANVIRTYQDNDSIVRFQGKPAIALMISTSTKDNLLHVSDAIKKELKLLQPVLPSGIQTDVMADMAPYIDHQLDMLGSNAVQGLIIVVIILGLFLEVRLAFWVAMGIPVSLAGAVWMMGLPSINYSINDITLFGMILILGVLVDDAIVVGESIHQERQAGLPPAEAALKGVDSVAVATVFGALTTIAAFSPMLWIENELAKVLAGFSGVAIFALLFSLIESKFILPAHLCFPVTVEPNPHRISRGLQSCRKAVNQVLCYISDCVYRPVLMSALNNRVTALTVFLLIALSAYMALVNGHIRSAFFPDIPGRYGTLIIKMDQSASPELSKKQVAYLEKAVLATSKTLQESFHLNHPPVSKYFVSRESLDKLEVDIELSNEALSVIPGEDVLSAWKTQTGSLEGNVSMQYTLSSEFAGSPSLVVSSPDRALGRYVVTKLEAHLKAIQGVRDVTDNGSSGRRQLQVVLNDRGIQLGISQRDIARVIGSTYGEIELHRLLEKGEEVSVVVRIPNRERKTLTQLASTPVNVSDGRYVSLGDIATLTFSHQAQVINRRNYDEVIQVSWKQDPRLISGEEVLKILQKTTIPQLQKMYPEVKIARSGAFAEQDDVQHGFREAMLLTLLLIYVLLAVPLKSYWQPFIIMSVIPFGFAGAIFGHGLMDLPVSLLSMFGMMAMTGVVINDSLVLLTRFNQLYESGLDVRTALIEAGRSRMRAIFLTTLTTVCGLLPLLSETSEQAQYLKPAAVSLVFGELFATPVTLILVPVILSLGKKLSPKLNRS